MLQLIAMTFALHAWAETPNPGPRSPEQAQFLYQEALDARKKGNDDLAIEDFQKILKQYPTFKETLMVHEKLMELHLAHQRPRDAIDLGKKAILMNPSGRAYGAIQLLRAEAALKSGKPSDAVTVIQELIKAKPDQETRSKALLLKAESLSQLGKHKEAIASLDAARGHEQYPDAELKLRARACGSKKPENKSEEFEHLNRKNLCFKESAALAKSEPAKDAAQVWCDQINQFESELKKSKTDQFTKDRIAKEIALTKGLSATWGCKMSPKFKNLLADKAFSERALIQKWFESKFQEFPPSFYCSVDIRDSGGKIVPVDCNLFPAGFNNICEYDLEAPPLFRSQIERMARAHSVKIPEKILIIPESHTENKFYLENLYYLKSILEEAAFDTAFGRYDPECTGLPNVIELTTHSEKKITQASICKVDGILQTTTGFVPDWIILNNDFSQGYPECLDGVKQPIFPSHKLGWHSRKKSTHFDFYNLLATEFANLIGIDPWRLTIASRAAEDVNFNEGIGMDRLIETVEEMLGDLQEQYRTHGIDRKPALFIKNDSGTYGMGIMVVESADEIRNMNRRTKNKMSVGKGKSTINRVIVQEGVPTLQTTTDQFTAETVIYIMGEELIGGFIRANTERGDLDNLNSQGMFFRKLCFKDLSDSLAVKTEDACPEDFPTQEAIYGIVAKLSALAAAMEIKEQ